MKIVYFKYNNLGNNHPLNGFEEDFRNPNLIDNDFSPICLVGINGSGKSKLLECFSEVFEYITGFFTDFVPAPSNKFLSFQIDYLFKQKKGYKYVSFQKEASSDNVKCFLGQDEDNLKLVENYDEVRNYLPEIVIGYTSGENESLSSWFHPYNDIYSSYYQERAIYGKKRSLKLPYLPHFLWVDFHMNSLVFIANAILGISEKSTWSQITNVIDVDSLRSFRITLKLKPKNGPVNGIIPAAEQIEIIDKLKKCASSSISIEKENTLILDFYKCEATINAFKKNFNSKLDLYVSLFQLYLLNHILIRSDIQEIKKIEKETKEVLDRPTVPDNQKAFNISHIRINHKKNNSIISYNDLSDGEHQYLHVFGTLNMVNKDNVLFLMDEPETHFNPQWRSAFISQMKSTVGKTKQEYIISTHSPFLLSDSKSENVFIFSKSDSKIKIDPPKIQTYGTAIDKLLEIAFGVSPPIAKLSSNAINKLINDKNKSIEELEKEALAFGDSIKKMMLYHHIEEKKEEERQQNK